MILAYLNCTPLSNYAGTSLKQRIRQTMYIQGLSQRSMAKAVDVDESSIKRVLEGRVIMKKTREKIEQGIHLL